MMNFAIRMENSQALGVVIVRIVVKRTGCSLVWKLNDGPALPILGSLKRGGLACDENLCAVLFQ